MRIKYPKILVAIAISAWFSSIHSVIAQTAATPVPVVGSMGDNSPKMDKRADVSTLGRAGPKFIDKMEEYRLGIGDRLKVTIYEGTNQTKVYKVNYSGAIKIPFLGEFSVVGRTVGHLEQELGAAYRAALNRQPQIIVEIAEYRPYFVLGLVNKPGAYPYRPQMSVLHAVALAGGILRLGNNNSLAADASRESARMVQTTEDLKRAMARLVRLETERDGATKLEPPQRLVELAGIEEARRFLDTESLLLKQRRLSHQRRLAAFETTVKLSKSEVTTLQQQLTFIREQSRLKRQFSKEISKLERRGLATRTRVLEMKGDVALLEREFRAVVAGVTRAQQVLAKAERDFSVYRYERRLDLERNIAKLQHEIAKSEAALRGSENLIKQITAMAAGTANLAFDSSITYQIMRQNDLKTEFQPAYETTRLRPGDVLRVLPPHGK